MDRSRLQKLCNPVSQCALSGNGGAGASLVCLRFSFLHEHNHHHHMTQLMQSFCVVHA